MTSIVLEGPIAELREREIQLLTELADKVSGLGEDGQKDRARIQRNANDLRDMFFMVVVIGEFNAGKSSFVNAVLGDEILPMGITPTTEVIELIRYSREKNRPPQIREDGTVREWMHPNTGAPGVTIVDTPGTGSVFEKHERIAKDFLSRSDLVIFLLSAKRAFANTEKLYLEMARDYGKKIILVINQIDLLEKKELREVQAFVRQQAKEMLNLEPPIFLVSAKQALKGGSSGGLFSRTTEDSSGIDGVREHLAEVFRRTPPAKQKLYTQLDFADSLLTKYLAETQKRLDLVTNDERQAKQLIDELKKQAETLAEQKASSIQQLDKVFSGLRSRGEAFIAQNLSAKGSLALRGVSKDEIETKFETEVIGKSLEQINEISEGYINAVVDSSRRYWRSVLERLNKLQAMLEEYVVAPDAGNYSEQGHALQTAMQTASSELKAHTDQNLAHKLHQTFSNNRLYFNVGGLTFLSGAISLIMIALPGALALNPLTLLAAPITLVGGGATYIYWRKLKSDALKELDTELKSLRIGYEKALDELTQNEQRRLLQQGMGVLTPVVSYLETLAETYRQQQTDFQALQSQAAQLRAEIDQIEIIMEA